MHEAAGWKAMEGAAGEGDGEGDQALTINTGFGG